MDLSKNQNKVVHTFFTRNWPLNDLTLNCLIATSWLHRSLFIKIFCYWIHHSLYWRSYKRKSIGTLFHQQFSLENPRYILTGPFYLTPCSWEKQLLFFCFWYGLKWLSQIIRSRYGDKKNQEATKIFKKLIIVYKNLNLI